MHLKTVVYTLFIGAFFFLSSCNRDNLEATVPGYLVIDTFNVNYSEANRTGRGLINISDAWVYVNDDIQGVFELPARIPLTDVGEGQTITIGPGIKVNGIAATRDEYPFYSRSEFSNVDINPDSTIHLEPTVNYYNTTEFSFLEDFESTIIRIDTVDGYGDAPIERVRLEENDNSLGRYVGFISLNEDSPELKLITNDYYALPRSGNIVYLELDYKCNATFVIGLAVRPNTGAAYDYAIIWVNPTNRNSAEPQWNKMYLNLTDHVSNEGIDAELFGFTITASHSSSLDSSYFYFDNMKLVHF